MFAEFVFFFEFVAVLVCIFVLSASTVSWLLSSWTPGFGLLTCWLFAFSWLRSILTSWFLWFLAFLASLASWLFGIWASWLRLLAFGVSFLAFALAWLRSILASWLVSWIAWNYKR